MAAGPLLTFDKFLHSFDRGPSCKTEMIVRIGELNNRVTKGRELLLAGDIDGVDFKTIKTECEKQIAFLEAKLNEITDEKEDIAPILNKAVDYLAKQDDIYQCSSTIKKRQIIGSIFPEKLMFDRENFRTARLNEAVQLTYSLEVAFTENKNGTSLDFSNLSHQVNEVVQSSNQLCTDFDKLF